MSYKPPFSQPTIKDRELFPDVLTAMPITRLQIDASPGWFASVGQGAASAANQIVEANRASINQFVLGQRQNVQISTLKQSETETDLPGCTVNYRHEFGQEIITLTVRPANVSGPGLEIITAGIFDINVPFTGWPIPGLQAATGNEFPDTGLLYDPFFTPTVPTASQPDIPAMADPSNGGTGIFTVFPHSEGGGGAGYYNLEWIDVNGPSGFETDLGKGTFNKNGVPPNWWTSGVGGSGICITPLSGQEYWEIKIITLPTNVPDTQTFHAPNGDDDQQSWTQTPEEYLSEGTISLFYSPSLNTFFSPSIGLVTKEFLDPRWKKNTVAYGGVIGLDPDPKPTARTIGMTRLSTLYGTVETGEYIPDGYRVDKPYKLKFVPTGEGAFGGTWQDDTILMDDDIFLAVGRGLSRSPQGKPLSMWPDPYPWGTGNIVVQGTTVANGNSSGITDGQFLYTMWAVGPGAVNGPLGLGNAFNTTSGGVVQVNPFDDKGPMTGDDEILFPLTLGEACYVCVGQVGGPVWGQDEVSPPWITDEVDVIANEAVAPMWTWQIDKIDTGRTDTAGVEIIDYIPIQTINNFLTYFNQATNETYHINGGTVKFEPGQNKVNDSFNELFGDITYGYSNNKTAKYSPIYKGRLDCLPTNFSPADDSPIGHVGQNGVWSGIDLGPLAEDDVIMMATDTSTRKVWYGKNGKWHDQTGPTKHQPGDKGFACAMLMDGDQKTKYYPAASFRVGPTHLRMYFGAVQKYQPPAGFNSYGVTKIDIPGD